MQVSSMMYCVHFLIYIGHRSCSVRKDVIRKFAKFTRKHLCQSLFFNKAAGFIKKRDLTQVFPCKFCEMPKNTFSYRTLPVAASFGKLTDILCEEASTLETYPKPTQTSKMESFATIV